MAKNATSKSKFIQRERNSKGQFIKGPPKEPKQQQAPPVRIREPNGRFTNKENARKLIVIAEKSGVTDINRVNDFVRQNRDTIEKYLYGKWIEAQTMPFAAISKVIKDTKREGRRIVLQDADGNQRTVSATKAHEMLAELMSLTSVHTGIANIQTTYSVNKAGDILMPDLTPLINQIIEANSEDATEEDILMLMDDFFNDYDDFDLSYIKS
jgi:hypothetical protein